MVGAMSGSLQSTLLADRLTKWFEATRTTGGFRTVPHEELTSSTAAAAAAGREKCWGWHQPHHRGGVKRVMIPSPSVSGSSGGGRGDDDDALARRERQGGADG